MAKLTEVMERHLKLLNVAVMGKRIVKIEYSGDGFPVINLSDGAEIWIQSDDESNGPGVAVHIKDGVEMGTWQI